MAGDKQPPQQQQQGIKHKMNRPSGGVIPNLMEETPPQTPSTADENPDSLADTNRSRANTVSPAFGSAYVWAWVGVSFFESLCTWVCIWVCVLVEQSFFEHYHSMVDGIFWPMCDYSTGSKDELSSAWCFMFYVLALSVAGACLYVFGDLHVLRRWK